MVATDSRAMFATGAPVRSQPLRPQIRNADTGRAKLFGSASLACTLPQQRSGQVRQMRSQLAFADRRGWRDFAPAIVLLMVSAVGIFVAAFSPSADRGQYAIVAPPWYSPAQTADVVGMAGGDIVDVGGLPSVVIARSTSPGFVRALYRAGAWLVIDPVQLRGCLGFERHPAPAAGGV
jgi:hypothetical protein